MFNYENDNALYESIMASLQPAIHNSINEAYDNMLLESFNFKEFVDNAINASKKTIANIKDPNGKVQTYYRFFKKFVALTALEIKKTKGAQAVAQYMSDMKAQFAEDLKAHNLTPQQMIKRAKILAIAILGTAAVSTIAITASNEVQNAQSDNITAVSDSIEKSKVDTVLPIQYAKVNTVSMTPSDSCVDLIIKHEVEFLHPYFATASEKRRGIITIGCGHVLCENFKNWRFPDSISPERQKQIKDNIMAAYKKGLIHVSLCESVNGTVVDKHKDPNMKDIITDAEAKLFLKADLKKTDTFIKQSLGLMKCGEGYDVTNLIDKNVAYYCYFNQKIYDALAVHTFNTGTLKKRSKLSQCLQNCRYDEDTNSINKEDLAYTFKIFKEGQFRNTKRSEDEYFTLGLNNTNNVAQSFDTLI